MAAMRDCCVLGRAYMAVHKYRRVYRAYRQAAYRPLSKTSIWHGVGILERDTDKSRRALDASSLPTRTNPYTTEVRLPLGSLYESCSDQISNAINH